MKQPLLVLDCHYLCHRAFHAQGDLSWKGRATGVVFGFLKSIVQFKEEFNTDRIVFCFESKHLFRRDVYPTYKQRREQKRTPEEKQAYTALAFQISELRQRYLPQIGFKNIFSFDGYESDDIMAKLALSAPDAEEVILVTSDSDLWQVLRPNVSIYQPSKQKFVTEQWFIKEHKMFPSKWAVVKAIAGCDGDGVEGIKGVGVKTALRYIHHQLKEDSVAYQAITSEEGRQVVLRNRELVQLPYRNCPLPKVVVDKISRAGWQDVCNSLGMKSLAGRPPVLIGPTPIKHERKERF